MVAPTTDEFNLDSWVSPPEDLGDPQMLMFVGPPGGGKSWLAASAAEVDGLWPVLIIDTEGSTQGTLRGLPKDRIDVLRPQERFDGKDIYPKTVAVLEGLLSKPHKYKTVVIDTADILQRWARAYGHDEKNKFAQWEYLDDELTNPAAYTRDGKMVARGLFHRLKAADFLTILVVHDKQDYDADGTLMNDTYLWQGAGKTKLGGIPDILGIITRNTTSSGSKSTMRIGSSLRATTKNRYESALPGKIEEPTLKAIYAAIRKEDK